MNITEQDAKDLRDLIAKNIEVEIRMLPGDKKILASDVI